MFLLKLSYKNSCFKFDAFSRRNSYFFSQKRDPEKQSVNYDTYYITTVLYYIIMIYYTNSDLHALMIHDTY